jgi:hypothetical protein
MAAGLRTSVLVRSGMKLSADMMADCQMPLAAANKASHLLQSAGAISE